MAPTRSARRWMAVAGAGALVSALFACAPRHQPIPSGRTLVVRAALDREGGDSTTCLVRVPEGYDPDRPWPLVVALHGYGSDAAPFLDLWQDPVSAHGAVIAAPRGDAPAAEGFGRAWGPRSAETIERSVDAVRGLVNVDPSRVFVAGFSQGGGTALSLVLRHPGVFRSAAFLGTAFGADRLTAIRMARERPVGRVYIGRGSLEPDLEGAKAAAGAFEDLGCAVTLAVYPGVGHGLPEPKEDELNRILDFLTTEN